MAARERLFHVGIERLLVGEDFELHQLPIARLAREAERAQRFVGSEAAGGVGQEGRLLRIDVIGETLLGGIGKIHAPHRDGDDLGAAGFKRGGVLGVGFVLAGADDEAGGVALAGDGEWRVSHSRVRS